MMYHIFIVVRWNWVTQSDPHVESEVSVFGQFRIMQLAASFGPRQYLLTSSEGENGKENTFDPHTRDK